MRIRQTIRDCRSIVILLLLLALIVSAASVQALVSAAEQRPKVTPPSERGPAPAARETEIQCGGYIEYYPAQTNIEIVGGEQEQEQRVYSQGDYVYINAGSGQGLKAGQEFTVVRPRGRFSSKFTKKRGRLGVYTQEIGRLRLVEVKDQASVALITKSCEMMLLGDLLRTVSQNVSPIARTEVALNRFADPSGKQTGRIVLARDGREMLSDNQIVFVDLGEEDQVKQGDYLTIYRPAGSGNVTRLRDEEITTGTTGGFESDRYKGGKFSTKASRVEDADESSSIINRPITTHEVKSRRPAVPRMVVGEAIILNVQARTATAVITRTAQEVHTGDFVEVQ